VNYEECEQQIVPEEDRQADKYDGYHLLLLLEEFGKSLRAL
jgi:hypothetical protein